MSEESENIYQRLLAVQAELVAPRQEGGRFGNARSAEQILEAAKPVCRKHGLYLYTTDVVRETNGRSYVTATATVINVAKPEEVHGADANAWEGDISRGLDAPQVTGSASSYAKKYALQNLFAIDDTKDADHEAPGVVPATRPAISGEGSPKKKRLAELMTELHIKNDERGDFFQAAIGKDKPETPTDVDKAIVHAETMLADADETVAIERLKGQV